MFENMATKSEKFLSGKLYFYDTFIDKLVLWMIPRTIYPNHITWLRIILTPLVVYVNFTGNYVVGIPLFLFAAFTDTVDGSLARTRSQITNFGKLFDPFADKLLIGSMTIVLVFQHLNVWVAATVLLIELILVSFGLKRGIKGRIEQANIWGKIKMILQVAAVALILFGIMLSSQLLFSIAMWTFGAAIIFGVISLVKHSL